MAAAQANTSRPVVGGFPPEPSIAKTSGSPRIGAKTSTRAFAQSAHRLKREAED